ncbi:hypothetical protein FMO003_44620 [Moritella sp. F3]|nr:hypothetical protein FMO001_44350 [Moritella sp. F1]GIC84182.1 hypothetical protein FMO003_44620 [Moritella sp. F3]
MEWDSIDSELINSVLIDSLRMQVTALSYRRFYNMSKMVNNPVIYLNKVIICEFNEYNFDCDALM